jgi:predicted nucleic acid-binding protein
MPALLWDASALAKRYVPEQGSRTVDALFENVALSQMVGTLFGYAEVFSVVLRKHNRWIDDMTRPDWRQRFAALGLSAGG